MTQFTQHIIVAKMATRHMRVDHNMARYHVALWKNKGYFALAEIGYGPNAHPHASSHLNQQTDKNSKAHRQHTSMSGRLYSVGHPMIRFTHGQTHRTAQTSPNAFGSGPCGVFTPYTIQYPFFFIYSYAWSNASHCANLTNAVGSRPPHGGPKARPQDSTRSAIGGHKQNAQSSNTEPGAA